MWSTCSKQLNLEAGKTILAQETLIVQVVVEPEFSLKKNKLKYSIAILAGIIISCLAFSFYVLANRKKPN
jgi:hypothetical protein